MNRRSGFSIVELLVVIAISSILAALLLPVLSANFESAREAACRNNLRQVGFGVQLYSDDYRGWFPTYDWYPGITARWDDLMWMCEISPYLSVPDQKNLLWYNRYWSNTVFSCPSLPQPAVLDGTTRWQTPVMGIAFDVNYRMYTYIKNSAPSISPTMRNLARLSLYRNPGAKIMLGDCGNGFLWQTPLSALTYFRHSGRANVCFIAGNIKPCTAYEVPALYAGTPESDAWWRP